jgi:7-cyano-7-deazaguanine synthase in queuosine biosynthesis
MSELAAQATEQGTVLLTVTSDTGQRGQAELSADKAEDLKKQLETALLAVRMRQIEEALASPAMAGKFMPQTTLSERQSPHTQAPLKRRRFARFLRRNGRV